MLSELSLTISDVMLRASKTYGMACFEFTGYTAAPACAKLVLQVLTTTNDDKEKRRIQEYHLGACNLC